MVDGVFMFNIKEVISSFEDDSYGFTKNLTLYINNHDQKLSAKIINSIEEILSDAYDKSLPEAQKVVQNALFIINLCYPLSIPARLQYDQIILSVRRKIEDQWLTNEFKFHDDLPADNENFADFLVKIRSDR